MRRPVRCPSERGQSRSRGTQREQVLGGRGADEDRGLRPAVFRERFVELATTARHEQAG
ncbi:hypothetical protein ACF07Y_36645 [Streptomyces sp. NPDC016566]|uniref:hypothetical protein n=1 Tax=Streptomyces sp. NPDC016566 TaxID=3364967 RepID=UPI003701E818